MAGPAQPAGATLARAPATLPREVGMGRLAAGSRGDTLVAVLGSCVGLALLWPQGGRCALAHCLLPAAPPGERGMGARYVDQAVPSMLTVLGATPADYADIDVVVAGGASMLGPGTGLLTVGRQNIVAALAVLQRYGLRVTDSDLGGHAGRRMLIDCARYQCAIQTITTPALEAADHGKHRHRSARH
ncbi:chemotaxis protein CheD [Pseudoduganella namucuonensis]|uniref:Chemotaxis protein CheD n=1 Tax=Pseudoduganella namucuonensis TaxID=1035707 RepID=A0A1I7HCH5_9BURK|nr:chemotaxis protein CheD [Pseudoduganella namucuonensis]SFU58444.1 chemotaxis protein CheD [Pseudoduganella namucuonensis]